MLLCRQNVADALSKLQEIIDSAVEAVTPKEIDPAVRARVQKAYATLTGGQSVTGSVSSHLVLPSVIWSVESVCQSASQSVSQSVSQLVSTADPPACGPSGLSLSLSHQACLHTWTRLPATWLN